ncbi:metallophosphoesterase [Polaribacter undariae]|uniref:Metallophosphoesterase n=1 Tax=Polaribacter sejongensis TaxID=985043 RepID=A0AAJ1QZ05_9FLAO|nr:metallophosphoesterase [Polaribacter undariae]MDN3620782.1 metallophosphoesterase [Polaribacter undariae]UWD31381.1 metallophosphoesterase [Polaribacter undariae]
MFKKVFLLLLIINLIGCKQKESVDSKKIQIAFMADVHLQDIYGELSDSEYKGVFNTKTNTYALARTMQSQLESTRLFNENYFAFITALDNVVERGIKYVVLPGDFSDDGQPLNIRGLKRILKEYEQKYNIQFIAATGNHDVVKPFYQDAGKKDFLGEGGKNQPIYSKEGMFESENPSYLKPIITKDIAKLGYEEILSELADFGFYPKKTDVYWETPFSTYNYEDYSFKKAKEQADILKRNYKIPPYKTVMPDVSYLLEPKENLWFLSIDANVYIPKQMAEKESEESSNYNSASIGYNNVLTHKKHLLTWVKSVAERAEKLGKNLIVFSHYPMVDFNDDASDDIRELLGENKMQLHRVPKEEVASLFAKAGVKVHFGGHMHINDTGVRKGLVNVQIPSLSAYIPAYKVLTISENEFDVETVVIDKVSRFKELFPLYEMEFNYLKESKAKNSWNKEILEVNSYKEFTNWHLKELVRLRFLKKDWPKDFKDFFLEKTGEELMILAGKTLDIDVRFSAWTGFDMLFDLYRLRSADALAIEDIGAHRMKEYKELIKLYKAKFILLENPTSLEMEFYHFCVIFEKFSNGEPTNHFKIDLSTLKISEVN